MKSQDLKLLLGSADMGVVSPGKLGYVSLALKRLGCVSSTPPTWRGKFLALDGQTRTGFFCGSRAAVKRPCCVSQAFLLASAV
jgi:hypothetical protein